MTIETILEYLNAVPVRATYGAVGEVLGVRPQVVPRLLGARRPEASWVVNGTTGEPTGYAPEEVDPRLPGTRVIRSGDELQRGLESETGPAPEAVSAVSEAVPAVSEAVPAAPEAVPVVNSMAAPRMEDAEIITLGSDAKWIIGTLVPVLLLVAGLLATQIASVGGSLNARIDDVNQRLDDLRADLSAQIADVNARIDDVRSELNDEIAALRGEVRSFDARLRAVEVALGIGPGAAPAPDEGEQASDPDTSASNPDAPATDPDAPAADPDPEPPTDTAPPAANPAPPPE